MSPCCAVCVYTAGHKLCMRHECVDCMRYNVYRRQISLHRLCLPRVVVAAALATAACLPSKACCATDEAMTQNMRPVNAALYFAKSGEECHNAAVL